MAAVICALKFLLEFTIDEVQDFYWETENRRGAPCQVNHDMSGRTQGLHFSRNRLVSIHDHQGIHLDRDFHSLGVNSF